MLDENVDINMHLAGQDPFFPVLHTLGPLKCVWLTIDDGRHGQHYSIPVVNDRPDRFVSDDWQVGLQMAVTLSRKREGSGEKKYSGQVEGREYFYEACKPLAVGGMS